MGNCNCIRLAFDPMAEYGSNINDRHPNTFVVAMIDERGRVTSEGTIKITATDLVLNRRGREDMWPLKSLRQDEMTDLERKFCPTIGLILVPK